MWLSRRGGGKVGDVVSKRDEWWQSGRPDGKVGEVVAKLVMWWEKWMMWV